ncbi:MAG: hypothetical protein JHC95_15550 [Solirubrobacteraceae bacterium]|nr:hypothetical protein [Solirubrobacteraceae bacterium]
MQQNPWVALDATTDRRRLARALARARESTLRGGDSHGVRDVIAESWARSGEAGVAPTGELAPSVLTTDEAEARWSAHPLAAGMPMLRALLADVHSDDKQVVLVCDADGTILWVDGEPALLDEAHAVNLAAGAGWSEGRAGTNAPGLALAVDHPVQVFSAEHYAEAVEEWTCSAAPVHDPETGETVGVIDLSGELATAHPHSLALVAAAAQMLHAGLAQEAAMRNERLRERYGGAVGAGGAHAGALVSPSGRVLLSAEPTWASAPRLDLPATGGEVELPDGRARAEPIGDGDAFLLWRVGQQAAQSLMPRTAAPLAVEALGRDRVVIRIGGEPVELTPRRSEILVLLLLEPAGISAERLAIELYGDFGKPVSVRAELSRLRRLLGDRLEANPYRLRGATTSDLAGVEGHAADGDLAGALARYTGPLLPSSEVPAIVETRERLDYELREGVLRSGDPALLHTWIGTPSGRDDLVATRALVELLDPEDERRARALSRLRRLSQPAEDRRRTAAR